jgi:integrase
VIFIDPERKRIARHFADKGEAVKYHRELLRKANQVGTAGLVLDEEMRAEYFGARRALGGVRLMTAVSYYLEHQAAGLGLKALEDVVEQFLSDKLKTGRSGKTVAGARSTLTKFLAEGTAVLAADFTRDAVTAWLDGLDSPPLTIRTHRARLSAFGEWMARRRYISENPTRYVEVARYDPRPPRVLTAEESVLVMEKASIYRDGLFAGTFALALFAGLRLGEIERLTWSDINLDEKTPIVRVGRGKIRGRRAIRVVPVDPALLSWLKWVKAKKLPLNAPGVDSRRVREVVEWQEDICRHSWISYRLALVKDEAQVSREAGNSPDVIYRHYYQLVNRSEAVRYFSTWPS